LNIIKEILPLSAILCVILLMAYTDIFIIGELGRILSLVPIFIVLLIWSVAIAKLRRDENVH
jgi:hypothetical protein